MENPIFSHEAFDRKGVLLLGDFNFDTTSLKERNLRFQKVTFETIDIYINHCRAIIIADYPSKFNLINRSFDTLLVEAANRSILLIILSHSVEDSKQIENIRSEKIRNIQIDEKAKSELSRIYFADKLADMAEAIVRHKSGPKLKEVILKASKPNEFNPEDLEPELKVLLKRSFFDCEKIYVERISGGKGSDYLFKVDAWIKGSETGPYALPFFAKIAKHDIIRTEITNYHKYADMYISFQFRPNCKPERCVKTLNYSSLVGNFVEDSILLRTALKDTHHFGIIFSLFERSLRGFRLQPFILGKAPGADALTSFIFNTVKIDLLKGKTRLIAKAKEFDFKSEVEDLYLELLKVAPKSCLTGLIHGDLNMGNVMVRGNDAIVIDFASVNEHGPIAADPVALEISLCFDLPDPNESPGFEKWKEFIDEAYDPNRLFMPLTILPQKAGNLAWLRRSIREIRHILIGCDCCDEEKKAIIACYLLRIARLTPDEVTETSEMQFKYRAYALVVAERIIKSIIREKDGGGLQ